MAALAELELEHQERQDKDIQVVTEQAMLTMQVVQVVAQAGQQHHSLDQWQDQVAQDYILILAAQALPMVVEVEVVAQHIQVYQLLVAVV